MVTVLLISWFVTSSDSGTLVMCTMLSMGDEHPPIKFRLFWGITSGVVASVLMLAGGLSALQTASIVAGRPIAILLLVMAQGLARTLSEDFPVLDVEEKRELEYLNRKSPGWQLSANSQAELRPPCLYPVPLPVYLFAFSLPYGRWRRHEIQRSPTLPGHAAIAILDISADPPNRPLTCCYFGNFIGGRISNIPPGFCSVYIIFTIWRFAVRLLSGEFCKVLL